jgi:tRNA threonylcarbamoyladenosine biosynthesis protein TsaE
VKSSSWVSSSSSPEQTEAAGARLAARLRAGDVVLVSGELGSGKTTFVRGACRALGVTAKVTSPTFTIGHLYAGTPDVAHLDLFRLGGAEPGLLEDYLTPDRIGFLEWPELAGPELDHVTARVRIEHAGGDERRITACTPEGVE